ncbi:MAG: cytochrome ubiquinol oxidase subunit I [Planctomycetaceae bacterium]|nr:cytochrome ubiquinol oxidase subunit I [Planctomycetaceae bacterium]
MLPVLADIASNLVAARLQMALTLGFHIILACLGVGLPVLMLAAEWRFLRTGDVLWKTLARRWSKAFAVLFAIGAVSGTVLSFELGLLWPDFMGRWGSVIGLPFTMEGFAFFLEAIFAGIYLYGWERLSPRVHWLTGWPIAISGFLSALFVVTANSWMNTPTGFRLVDGVVTDVDPLAAMLNPAAGAQVTHMIVAAYLVTGFCVASFYAHRRLRGSSSTYHQRAVTLALLLAFPLVPVQMLVGDWSAKVVARSQPVKLAAMEGLYRTTKRAPLAIGGVPNETTRELDFALEIPGGLSQLAYGDRDAEVQGLDAFPPDRRPPIVVVHLAFQVMVGIGGGMFLAAVWGGASLWLRRNWPQTRWFWWSVLLLGPLSIVAMEAGWVVTEVGRQPWIVQGYMKTADAVTQAPGVWTLLWVTIAVYLIIGLATVVILRRLGQVPLPEETDGA